MALSWCQWLALTLPFGKQAFLNELSSWAPVSDSWLSPGAPSVLHGVQALSATWFLTGLCSQDLSVLGSVRSWAVTFLLLPGAACCLFLAAFQTSRLLSE